MTKTATRKPLFNQALIVAAAALTATLSFAKSQRPSSDKMPPPEKHGYFISIDGMRPDFVETLIREGKLTAPRGFAWLYRSGLWSRQANPVSTTLTAVSHSSTITCSYPSQTNIYANNFLSGKNYVSGFAEPISSETMWQSARAAGRSVMSFAYVGADGNGPNRTVDYGIAYPNNKFVGPSQTLRLGVDTLAAASGWTLPEKILALGAKDLRESTVVFNVNPVTKETKTYNILIGRGNAEGQSTPTQAQQKPASFFVVIAPTKNLPNETYELLSQSMDANEFAHLIFQEENAASSLKGYKRHVYATILKRPENLAEAKLEIFFSRATYNNASPASFRQALDDQNLVWPDDGWHGDLTPTGPMRQVNAYNLHGRFLAEAAKFAKSKYPHDVVLFYQPVIDSVGHSYQSLIPLPFSSKNRDPYTQGMVSAFQSVDQNISILLADATIQDVIALMGDHGMDPSRKVVNLAALVEPAAIKDIRVVTSGSLAMIYAAENATDNTAANKVAAEVDAKFKELVFEKLKPYGRAFKKSDFSPDEKDPAKAWQYGEALWAFTSNGGFYFKYDPISKDLYSDPSALGMHGQDNSVPTMATGFFFKAPGVTAGGELPPMNLIDAVPTFAKFMGFPNPKDCQGHALDIVTSRLRKDQRH